MTKPKISIVVAISQKKASIGRGGSLLFRISDDLKRFKALTLGHPVIMGRKTYEPIGKPLPDRPNIVITRNIDFNPMGVTIVHSLEDALREAEKIENETLPEPETKEIFVIGGGEIYKEALTYTNKLYLTIVESDAEGDVFFPDYSAFKKEVYRERRVDEKTGLAYTWIDLEK